MKEGKIKNAYELLFKEIQSFLTVLYIMVVGVGMIFNYQKYAEFGINIFQCIKAFMNALRRSGSPHDIL